MTSALDSSDTVEQFRLNPNAFTRQRQLGFANLVGLLMNQLKGGLRRESADFFESVLDQASGTVSAAAISQARRSLNPELFRHLNKVFIEYLEQTELKPTLWHGFRVLATDGSVLNLPNRTDLHAHFQGGANGTENMPPQARLSMLIDVNTGLAHHAELSPYYIGEAVGAAEHRLYLPEQSITLYDRGYASFFLLADHRHQQRDYCLRVKRGFNPQVDSFFNSDVPSAQVTIQASHPARKLCQEQGVDSNDITVRLVRVILSTGETEVLMTSLLDEQRYPSADFGKLYVKRWGVETGFRDLKSRLELENFSSYRVNGIYQDVYAKILMHNLAQLLRLAAQQQLEQEQEQAPEPTSGKHFRRVSFVDTLHVCKHRFIQMILGNLDTQGLLNAMLQRLQRCLELVRPEREQKTRSKRICHVRFPLNCKHTA